MTISLAHPAGTDALTSEVHRRALDALRDGSRNALDLAGIVRAIEPLAPAHVVDEVVARVTARIDGFGPIDPLLRDPTVSEVMINGAGPVWAERNGITTRSDITLERPAVDLLIERMVAPLGRRVDQLTPYVDGRLADGSRFHVVVPPVAVDGPYVTIRRFIMPDVSLEDFVVNDDDNSNATSVTVNDGADATNAGNNDGVDATSVGTVALLDDLIERGANIIVSGGTGAGKTTLLNAMAKRISTSQRVITIEDAAELQFNHPHVIRLEARPASREGTGAVTIRDLVRNALRMRPDRLVVGEVRGPEALDLLHALNTGHAGCLSTIHANSPVDALRRLATLAVAADERLPVSVVEDHIVAAIDAIVHVARDIDGTRKVQVVAEVEGPTQVRVLNPADSRVCNCNPTTFQRPARL